MKKIYAGLITGLFILCNVVFGGEVICMAATIDFESAEGYTAGNNLYGQPSPGNAWAGEDEAGIQITNSAGSLGSQSVLIDPSASDKTRDYLDVGSIPNQFMLEFDWRPIASAQPSGDATFYLSQNGNSISSGVGPWVQFASNSTVYQIKYLDGGYVRNIKLGMDINEYVDQWWGVKIIGDLSSHTFDFYFNGMLEGEDLEYRHNLDTNKATSLNYLGLQASETGNTDFYFDNIRISAVPIPSTISLLGIGLLGLAGANRRNK